MTKAEILKEKQRLEEELNTLKAEYQKPKIGGVVAQLKQAIGLSWQATIMGIAAGAVVPVSVWWLVHNELTDTVWKPVLVLVLGGLVFSAKTVYQWSRLAFACPWKAFGFTLLLEGILTLSQTYWLGITALLYLAFINAAGSASIMAVEDKEKS